ncbi:MAG: transcription termination/antitermination protein NusG [Fuerstiella sp.]|nr:transcription termination/antitermination protein NusG [Fuerstiella sp.]
MAVAALGLQLMVDELSEFSGEMRWFVLKVQTNRERTIRDALLKKIKLEGLKDDFGEVVIPSEKVVDTRSGKARESERKLFPGYVMIQMVLNDDTWYLVRDTSGVGDFAGSAGKPIPMEQHEVDRMLGKVEEEAVSAPKVKIPFSQGEMVKITDGAFENFEGSIEEIDDHSGKISVLIEVFGRSTPVELDHWQVESI